jgi:hypothetical protein
MRRRVSGSARAAALLCLGLACMAASEASAHRRSADKDAQGIPIAALSHGQMAVISDYRGEILDLAARENRTDETFRRLLNFGSIQYTYCLWGLVPGSLRDEASPFNECSHAYLSAARELLAYLRQTSADKQAVEDLVSRIDADMVRKQASFVQCQYSSEAFNTAGLVYPAWGDVPSHLPSLATFAGLALTVAGGAFALGGGIKRRSGSEKQPD